MTVINPPNILATKFRYKSNHCGFTDTDLLIPILLKGPQLEHLYDKNEMWLHTLYSSIPELSFKNLNPNREKNTASVWGGELEGRNLGYRLTVSPAYRWNAGFQHNGDIDRAGLEYDLYSSYLLRLWTGAGIQNRNQDVYRLARACLQVDLGKLQLNYGRQISKDRWETDIKEIAYQLNDSLALEWLAPDKFGFTYNW